MSARRVVYLLGASLLGAVLAGAQLGPCPPPGGTCPPEGCGQQGDPELNKQKNRTTEPASYQSMTFSEFVALNAKAVDKKGRSNWTSAERDRVAAVENGGGVQVVAFLFDAKLSDPESCNCMRTDAHSLDFHIWLVRNKAQATKPKSFVVEITPRVRSQHPGWTVATLRKHILPHKWVKVRVRGLATFDSEHWFFVRDGKRASMWEIHPVFQFEICSPGITCSANSDAGWVKLEDIE